MSIRLHTLVGNAAIGVVVAILIGILVMREWANLETLSRAVERMGIVSTLSRAMIELSLERSLTQVALNLDEPIAPAIRQMLDGQRTLADDLFAGARTALARLPDAAERRRLLAVLDRNYRDLSVIRDQADGLMAAPISGRPRTQIEGLPARIKAMILSVVDIGTRLRAGIGEVPPAIADTDRAVQSAWTIREYGGRERTLFAIATARRDPLDRAALAYMNRNHGRVEEAWRWLADNADNPRLSPAVRAGIDALATTYFEDYDALRAALFAAGETGAYPVDFDTLFARSEEALRTAVSLVHVAAQDNIASVEAARQAAERRLVLAVAVAALALALTGFVIWFSLARVSRPLVEMTGAMQRLADGDTGFALAVDGRRDEIGAMARALGVFRENALRVARLDEERREQEAAASAERRATRARLAESFETTVREVADRLGEAARGIDAAAGAVRGGIEEARSRASRIDSAAGGVSGNIHAIAGAAEQLRGAIVEIGQRIETAAEVARRAVGEAGGAREAADGLRGSADSIGEVVSLIDDIADRTNLLALNATIEAARAGEAGKGFAVVAAEVKSLAGQTSRATQKITAEIADIQSSVATMEGAIEGIGRTINEISQISATVAAAVEEQEAATGEIAQSIDRASRESQTASAEIATVAAATDSAAGRTHDMLETSRTVVREASVLEDSLQAFMRRLKAA